MKNKNSIFKTIKALTAAAMLTAMSVVIGIFCKTLLNFGNGLFRITFENLPIILAGTVFGPFAGALVGAATDLLSYLLSPQVLPPNLWVTAGATAVGMISGLVSKTIVKQRGTKQFIVAGIAAHTIGSMLIKTIGLFDYYGWAVLVRIPLYLVIAAIEIFTLCMLYKRTSFRRLIDGLDKEI